MNSQQLLVINFIIFLALVLFFVLGRPKPKQPAQLDLKRSTSDIEPESEQINESKWVAEAKNVSDVAAAITSAPKLKISDARGEAIYFVYNGHEWEAFEVLGLPKGTTLQTATIHYQNLIKTSDPSTFEFFDAAYSAILKTKTRK